jgi:C4-dicarboxylate-binding protein DctP
MAYSEPIFTLDEMEGTTIRLPEVPLWFDFFDRLGIKATSMTWAEAFQGVQSGVVDGMEVPSEAIVPMKFYEVAPNVTKTSHCPLSVYMLMSQDAWESLPEDLQQIVDQSAYDAIRFFNGWNTYEDPMVEKALVETYGCTVKAITPEDRATMRKVASEMLEDPEWIEAFGPELIQLLKENMEQ